MMMLMMMDDGDGDGDDDDDDDVDDFRMTSRLTSRSTSRLTSRQTSRWSSRGTTRGTSGTTSGNLRLSHECVSMSQKLSRVVSVEVKGGYIPPQYSPLTRDRSHVRKAFGSPLFWLRLGAQGVTL